MLSRQEKLVEQQRAFYDLVAADLEEANRNFDQVLAELPETPLSDGDVATLQAAWDRRAEAESELQRVSDKLRIVLQRLDQMKGMRGNYERL